MIKIDPIEFCCDLIRCPSVTPKDEGALDVLQSRLESLGFKCTRLPFGDGDEGPDARVDNLYARLGTTAPNFCFAGHTDVVPEGDRDSWSSDPFVAEIRDGMLYGRGASDMKGAIAAFVSAVGSFTDKTGPEFGGSISLLITGDEEGEAQNGTVKMLQWLEKNGEALDMCLVGEPTNPETLGDMIKIGRRGSLTGYLTVRGTQGHTAYPHLADNPVHRLIPMLNAITQGGIDQGTDHFQPTTLQISTIDVGNPATNVIPAEAKAVFNMRFNDLHTGDDLQRWLTKIFDETVGPGGSYDLKVKVSGESFLSKPGVLSDAISSAVHSVTGQRPELSTTGGTSDARFIHNYCPVAEFGAIGKTMHKIDECVPVAALEALTEIYTAVLHEIFSKG